MEQQIQKLAEKVGVDKLEPRDLSPYVMSIGDLIAADIPPKKFLLSTFVPQASFGMVYANRGIGKSWFAMGLAVAVAEGHDTFLGWQIHKQENVLYVDGEMSLTDVRDRFKDLITNDRSQHLQILPSEQLYRDGKPVCLDESSEQESILNLLQLLEDKNNKPGLIILDNLSTLRRGINENDNSETQALLDFIINLRHRGYAVLVVHHTNKNGDKQRGASILEVPMDYTILLSEPSDGNRAFADGACFQLEIKKNRSLYPKNKIFVVELKKDDKEKLFFVTDTSSLELPVKISLLRAIEDCKGPISQRILAVAMDWSNGKVNKTVKALREKGFLIQSGLDILPKGYQELNFWFPEIYEIPEEYQEEIPF